MARFSVSAVVVAALLSAGSGAASAVTYSGTLPVMFITTENNAPVVSKEEYVKATYYIDNMGVEGIRPTGSPDSQLGMQIRGRGNWTWTGFDKKPYRIKLDEKAPLLGMNSSRHFALLAHADDSYGFMRNIVGFELSRRIGMPWTPADEPIEVVLNGDYIGLYFLTETVRVAKTRVNIVEQPDFATAADEITGGWLLEIDNYDSDPHVKIPEGDGHHDIIFTYKSPEELSEAQNEYLTDQVTAMDRAIYSTDVNDNSWEELIDADILARYYIVQEIVDDYESFHGSCYLSKNRGESVKWEFGPVWDFGSAFNYDKSQFIYQGREWHNTWIEQICRHPSFMERVRQVWGEFYRNGYRGMDEYIDNYGARIADAARHNAERWQQYGNGNIEERVKAARQRLDAGVKWLIGQWGPREDYSVYFRDNGSPEWSSVYVYMWYNDALGTHVLTAPWPGNRVTDVTQLNGETVHAYHFTSEALPDNAMIIFGNGGSGAGNQTADLHFENGGIYNRDGLVGGVTATEPEPSGVSVKASAGCLVVTAPCMTTISVADMTGRTFSIEVPAGESIHQFSPGIYIVDHQKYIVR